MLFEELVNQELFFLCRRVICNKLYNYIPFKGTSKLAISVNKNGLYEGTSAFFARIFYGLRLYSTNNDLFPHIHKDIIIKIMKTNFIIELIKELINIGIPKNKSKKVILDLISEISSIGENFKFEDKYEDKYEIYTRPNKSYIFEYVCSKEDIEFISNIRSKEPLKQDSIIKLPIYKNRIRYSGGLYEKSSNKFFKASAIISHSHYIKLIKMNLIFKKENYEINKLIFKLLLRYLLAFDDIGGYSYALPHKIFNKFSKLLNINTECFASPLNVYLDSYYSIFPDTDTIFGSRGSFFDADFPEGAYEVNPPFMISIIDKTVDKIFSFLELKSKRYLFLIILPHWSDAEFYDRLNKCPWKLAHGIWLAGKHSYIIGQQYMKEKSIMYTMKANSCWFLLSSFKDVIDKKILMNLQ